MTDPFRITAPGIYPNIATADYFNDPCPAPSLTQSLCKTLLDYSPAHARLEHPRLAPPKQEGDEAEKYITAQAIGNAAHLVMIGRGKDLAIGPFDSWRTKDAQAFRASNETAGKCVILEKHHDRAREMIKAASYHLERLGLREAFRIGQGEVMVAWNGEGYWFRSLVDWMKNTTEIYDYKTVSRCCAPHAVDALMANDGWDVQAAFQEAGLDVLDPENAGRRTFRFIVQENEPPYALTAVELPESVMTMGRKRVTMAAQIWRRCMEINTWPAYPANIHLAQYPGWMESRWLDREMKHYERRALAPLPADVLAGG